jgi:hypothetical protein
MAISTWEQGNFYFPFKEVCYLASLIDSYTSKRLPSSPFQIDRCCGVEGDRCVIGRTGNQMGDVFPKECVCKIEKAGPRLDAH